MVDCFVVSVLLPFHYLSADEVLLLLHIESVVSPNIGAFTEVAAEKTRQQTTNTRLNTTIANYHELIMSDVLSPVMKKQCAHRQAR